MGAARRGLRLNGRRSSVVGAVRSFALSAPIYCVVYPSHAGHRLLLARRVIAQALVRRLPPCLPRLGGFRPPGEVLEELRRRSRQQASVLAGRPAVDVQRFLDGPYRERT